MKIRHRVLTDIPTMAHCEWPAAPCNLRRAAQHYRRSLMAISYLNNCQAFHDGRRAAAEQKVLLLLNSTTASDNPTNNIALDHAQVVARRGKYATVCLLLLRPWRTTSGLRHHATYAGPRSTIAAPRWLSRT